MNLSRWFRGWAVVTLVLAVFISSTVFIQKTLALSWEQVSTSGFGDADNITSLNLVSFNDKLYASSGNYTAPSGVKIFCSSDGAIWTQVNTNGFGSAINLEAVMTVYDSALYAATDTLGVGMSELWKTTNGTDWLQVGQNGFGDIGNIRIIGMEEFNGDLYIGVTNGVTGAEVWRLDGNGTLAQVNTDGFDGTTIVNTIFSLQEFNGALYVGTGTDAVGSQVWKTVNGTTWSVVMKGGFGDTENGVISTLFSFNDQLYAGTINFATGTEIWRTTTDDTAWEQVNTDGFGDALTTWSGLQTAIVNGTIYLGTRNDDNGARLFISTNGSTWTQEGTIGFGDPTNNYAIYAITFDGRIYLAISSETGAEIWRTGEMGSLSIAETSLDEGTVGDAYVETLSTNNGTSPMSWSVTSGSLPDGVNLNTETGELSGTPSRAESFTFTVAVTDAGTPQQLLSNEYTVKINEKVEVLPETGSSSAYQPFYNFF